MEGNDEDEEINLEMKISSSEAAFQLDKLRTYSLQRSNREFSQSVLHLVSELENKIFREPKDYKQIFIDE